MTDEWYEYACPQKRMTAQRAAAEQKHPHAKGHDIIGYVSLLFILLVFSLPMAISKTLSWCIVFIVYVVLVVLNKIKDKDPYSSFLLFLGATLAYLGIVVSDLIVTGAYERFQYSCLGLLIISSVAFVICYECSVLVNMLFKKYTKRLQSNKSHPAINTAIGTFIGGCLGSLLAKRFSPLIATSLWSVWIVVVGCALLFATAFALLQKYILFKLLVRHN